MNTLPNGDSDLLPGTLCRPDGMMIVYDDDTLTWFLDRPPPLITTQDVVLVLTVGVLPSGMQWAALIVGATKFGWVNALRLLPYH